MPKYCQALVVVVLILFGTPISAAELNGQFASELYLTETGGQNHLRPYQRLRTDLTILPYRDGKTLIFHSYLRWTADFYNKKLRDPRTFVYDTYLKLTGVPDGAAFYLGRQFVYNGAGSVLMDGVRFKYQPVRQVSLDLFGGSSVSRLDPEQIRSISDFGTVGGRLSIRKLIPASIALNWMLQKSDGYVVSHRAGIESRILLGNSEIYGSFIYNLANLRAAGVVLNSSFFVGKWRLSGEFLWREPSVSSNTLFSLIDFQRYQEVRLSAQRRVWKFLSVIGQTHVSMFENDQSWRTGIGLRSDVFSIIWRHQEGYGGMNDALYGNLNLRFRKRWDVYAGANLGRYRIQEMQDDRSDSYASRLGARWRAGHGIMASTEVQYLRNAVESHDVRLYFRLSVDFSWKKKRGEGTR